MSKIFIIAMDYPVIRPGDVLGAALAEDGTGLGSHLSSNRIYARHDMGLTFNSSLKHKTYAEHYPDGYELVDLVDATDEDLQANAEYIAALAINISQRQDAPDAG